MACKRQRTSGSNSIVVDDEDFQCPICMDLMLGEIVQCREGHTLCGTCATGFLTCPTCRSRYPEGRPVRNRALEAMASKLTVPCKHNCGFRDKAGSMPAHWSDCPKRPLECPVGSCKEVVSLSDLGLHFEQRHSIADVGNGRLIELGTVEFMDRHGGITTVVKMASPVNPLIVRASFFDSFDMTATSGRCEIVQVRVFHTVEPVDVSVSLFCVDNACQQKLIVQGPVIHTEAVSVSDDPKSFKHSIRRACHSGTNIFLRKQMENVAQRQCIAMRLEKPAKVQLVGDSLRAEALNILVKEDETEEGLTAQQVYAYLHKSFDVPGGEAAVHEALQALTGQGDAYNTVDDSHFSAL
eukprot:TRINITY_DN22573_c0_g1_i1.p1 TRINITY_DN22573_c0_g1~~TRINITY_DN22573_c0_g1_i1.p1  ORF type:complete len:353 (-),score=46.06 TRINITY_DN22573_c0_g1_i1:251-1309(-)